MDGRTRSAIASPRQNPGRGLAGEEWNSARPNDSWFAKRRSLAEWVSIRATSLWHFSRSDYFFLVAHLVRRRGRLGFAYLVLLLSKLPRPRVARYARRDVELLYRAYGMAPLEFDENARLPEFNLRRSHAWTDAVEQTHESAAGLCVIYRRRNLSGCERVD